VDVQNGPLLGEGKAVLSLGNRAILQLFFLVKSSPTTFTTGTKLRAAKLQKPGLVVRRFGHIENLWAVLVWAVLVVSCSYRISQGGIQTSIFLLGSRQSPATKCSLVHYEVKITHFTV